MARKFSVCDTCGKTEEETIFSHKNLYRCKTCHVLLCTRWREKNPARARKILARAQRKWRNTHVVEARAQYKTQAEKFRVKARARRRQDILLDFMVRALCLKVPGATFLPR